MKHVAYLPESCVMCGFNIGGYKKHVLKYGLYQVCSHCWVHVGPEIERVWKFFVRRKKPSLIYRFFKFGRLERTFFEKYRRLVDARYYHIKRYRERSRILREVRKENAVNDSHKQAR